MGCLLREIWRKLIALYRHRIVLGNNPQVLWHSRSFILFLLLPRAARDGIAANVESTRLLLLSCWCRNSSILVAILSRSGVVDREIIRWNLSHRRSPCTNTAVDLETQKRIRVCKHLCFLKHSPYICWIFFFWQCSGGDNNDATSINM